MAEITGSTKIIGLIGDPVEHSISPNIHNAAFKKLNLNFCYAAFRVTPKDLARAVDSLHALGILGFNVTVPHKENIMKYLDEIDDSAKIIGAVNTVKITKGKLVGFNTDCAGFIASLTKDFKVDPKNKRVLIIGAGGGAKAIASALCSNKIKDLIITDIDKSKALKLRAILNKYFKLSIKLIYKENDIQYYANNCDILINATPIGMWPKINNTPIQLSKNINKNTFVYDIVYVPQETELLKTAKSLDLRCGNGLGMLVRQAAGAFKIFTGFEAPYSAMKKAAVLALRK